MLFGKSFTYVDNFKLIVHVFYSKQQARVVPQRSLDEWRIAFSNFGGVPRNLLSSSNKQLEHDVATQVKRLTPASLQSLIDKDIIMLDKNTHMLIQAHRYAEGDFAFRHESPINIASPFIARQIMLRWRDVLIGHCKTGFYAFLRASVTASAADVIFEPVAHRFILQHDSPPLTSHSLFDKSTFDVDLQNVNVTNTFWHEQSVLTFSESLQIDHYCRPRATNLPGIDSFVVKENNGQFYIIAFQFTISDSHPINVKFLSELWQLVTKRFGPVLSIKFVFVVPDDVPGNRQHITKEQSYKGTSAIETWKQRINQYVLRIDSNKVWDYLE